MPHHDFHPALAAQMSRQLFCKVNRTMLASGAAERHHQALKAATLIVAHASIHQRNNAGEELMHALLLVEILDHRRVFAREAAEALFASGIRDAASIEDESAAVPGIVFRQAPPV